MKWKFIPYLILLACVTLQTAPVMAAGDSGTTDVIGTVPLTTSSVSASAITTSSATISWQTSDNATSRVFYDTVYHEAIADYAYQTANDTSLVSEHSITLTGLSPAITYHYRVKSAIPEANFIAISDDYTFTTLAPITVTTNAATAVSCNSVRLSGNLTALGTATPVNVSFVWGTTSGGPYTKSTTVRAMKEPGSFSANITGLSADTKYYFKAKADGGAYGISYGSEKNFSTLSQCFIATAAYGTDTAEQINILREFRNKVLLRSRMGTAFVSFYYRVSPPIANIISRNEILRTIVREGLIEPLVNIVGYSRSLWSGRVM